MAGPNAREVDRVSVRVLPDTSRFATELRAQLAKAVQGIRVRIPVDVDMNRFAASLAKAKSELAKAQAAAAKDPLPGFNLDFGPTERMIARIAVAMHELPIQAKKFAQGAKEAANNVLSVAKRSLNVRQHWRSVGAGITSAAKRLREIKADGFYRNFLRVGDAVAGATGKLFRFSTAAGRALGRFGKGAAEGAKKALSSIGDAAS
ncbi:hypothetical protein ACFQ1S_32550, partial [Kibdelosporangium lantanae]